MSYSFVVSPARICVTCLRLFIISLFFLVEVVFFYIFLLPVCNSNITPSKTNLKEQMLSEKDWTIGEIGGEFENGLYVLS